MTPTPRLRWLEREHEVGLTGNMVHVETVLQQWYAYDIDYPTVKGEWRDVPTHEEREKENG